MSRAGSDSPGRSLRAEPLSLTVKHSDSMLLFRMAGDLHLATIGRLLSALDRVDLDRTTLLVFDLHDVAFIDLAGLTTILRANDDCADHAVHFAVVKPIGFASRVFTLTRVHHMLDLIDPAALEQRTGSSRRLESPHAPGASKTRGRGRAFGLGRVLARRIPRNAGQLTPPASS